MRWALNDESVQAYFGAPRKLHESYLKGAPVTPSLFADEQGTWQSNASVVTVRHRRLRAVGSTSARHYGKIPSLPMHAERRALERTAMQQQRAATEALDPNPLPPPCEQAPIIHPLLSNVPPAPPSTDDGAFAATQVDSSPDDPEFTPQPPCAPRNCGFP